MQKLPIVKSLFLDVLLNKVKEFLPDELKYVEFFIHEDDCLNVGYYSKDFNRIPLDHFFSDEEKKSFDDEECVDDYIFNSLLLYMYLDDVYNDFLSENKNIVHFLYEWNKDNDFNEHSLKQKELKLSELQTERDTLNEKIHQLSKDIESHYIKKIK